MGFEKGFCSSFSTSRFLTDQKIGGSALKMVSCDHHIFVRDVLTIFEVF